MTSVDKYLEQSGVYLIAMTDDGVQIRHPVKRGSPAGAEVIVVFGLSDVKFVDRKDCGTEKEAAVRKELEALAAERQG